MIDASNRVFLSKPSINLVSVVDNTDPNLAPGQLMGSANILSRAVGPYLTRALVRIYEPLNNPLTPSDRVARSTYQYMDFKTAADALGDEAERSNSITDPQLREGRIAQIRREAELLNLPDHITVLERQTPADFPDANEYAALLSDCFVPGDLAFNIASFHGHANHTEGAGVLFDDVATGIGTSSNRKGFKTHLIVVEGCGASHITTHRKLAGKANRLVAWQGARYATQNIIFPLLRGIKFNPEKPTEKILTDEAIKSHLKSEYTGLDDSRQRPFSVTNLESADDLIKAYDEFIFQISKEASAGAKQRFKRAAEDSVNFTPEEQVRKRDGDLGLLLNPILTMETAKEIRDVTSRLKDRLDRFVIIKSDPNLSGVSYSIEDIFFALSSKS